MNVFKLLFLQVTLRFKMLISKDIGPSNFVAAITLCVFSHIACQSQKHNKHTQLQLLINKLTGQGNFQTAVLHHILSQVMPQFTWQILCTNDHVVGDVAQTILCACCYGILLKLMYIKIFIPAPLYQFCSTAKPPPLSKY